MWSHGQYVFHFYDIKVIKKLKMNLDNILNKSKKIVFQDKLC